MTADHDIDFPTSANVGNYYDGQFPHLKSENERKEFIKRVCITASSRISSAIFEVGFYIDWEGETYDKAEAYKRATAMAQGVFLLDNSLIVATKPFRKANESIAHFWVRFTLAKGTR